MKVLVIDAGGRGNAIAHAFSRSKNVREVYVAPGNGGSLLFEKCRIAELNGEKIPSIRAVNEIVRFSVRIGIDIAYIGPEEPLSLGLVDRLEEAGIPAVGPKKEATILEASKCWAKDFMRKSGVPIPDYWNFDDPDEAKSFIKDYYSAHPEKNLVVKADGLAAGKGVFVCDSMEEAIIAVDEIMVKKRFGKAGTRVEIEERLYGIEVAFTALSDGKHVVPFGHAKDYKRAFDPDDVEGMRKFYMGYFGKYITMSEAVDLFEKGMLLNPNTGGMGAISPHPAVSDEVEERIMKEVVEPIVKKFRDLEGKEFRGVLYPVIMLVEKGEELIPKVLEINVRDCDPGAEAKLPRLESDILEISWAVIEQNLNEVEVKFSEKHAVAVCAVSGAMLGREGFKPGYPGDHYTNQPINGIEEVRDAVIYANGIVKTPNGFETTGGRVLTLAALDYTIEEARETIYNEIKSIRFPGMRYRRTIGLDVPE